MVVNYCTRMVLFKFIANMKHNEVSFFILQNNSCEGSCLSIPWNKSVQLNYVRDWGLPLRNVLHRKKINSTTWSFVSIIQWICPVENNNNKCPVRLMNWMHQSMDSSLRVTITRSARFTAFSSGRRERERLWALSMA